MPSLILFILHISLISTMNLTTSLGACTMERKSARLLMEVGKARDNL